MTKDDLRNVKPKDLEEQPYPKRKVPKKLDEVETEKNVKIRFGFGDYLRFAWMVLLGYAEEKLNPTQRLIGEKTLCYGAIGLAALAIIIFAISRFFG